VGKSLDGRELSVQVRDASGRELTRWIPSDAVQSLAEEPDLLGRLGLSPKRPTVPAVIGELVPGEAAEGAGLESGDRILSADGRPIEGWQDWVGVVREHPDQTLSIEIERADGERLGLSITPRSAQVEGETIGRIGAGVLVPDGLMDDYSVEVRYGPVESLDRAVSKTVEMSVMTLRVVGRMLIGQASVENLSGPITIAETAGRTASYGLESFVKFLAVVSISLGILNLLPVPVLDGGHLLYFFIEWVKGSPLSEEAQMQGQKIGLFLLAALMSLAFYLDLSRLLG
jgi:regulator of sigma E protease